MTTALYRSGIFLSSYDGILLASTPSVVIFGGYESDRKWPEDAGECAGGGGGGGGRRIFDEGRGGVRTSGQGCTVYSHPPWTFFY